MRKEKKFELFGIEYKTMQFSAVEGFDMVDCLPIIQPLEMLKYTSVVKYDGSEFPLNIQRNIDLHVKDGVGRIAPALVLRALMQIVQNHSFGFLREWKGTQIPNRFLSGAKTVSSEYVEPVIANLVTANLATMKELEEYYSLYDAFVMFDAMLVKTVNEAYAQEAAEAEARNSKR